MNSMRAGGMQRGRDVGGENAGRFQAQNRPDALAAGKDAVAHGLMNRSGRSRFRGQQLSSEASTASAVFFKESGKRSSARE